jgi:hypothetical protein
MSASRPGLASDTNCQQAPRPISSPINQQLIAERLKLSRTTVSRSLANHPAISADTRAQVQSLAAKMGYRGNPTRTLRRSRQSKPLTIGILIGVPAENVAMATFPFILQGIRERAGMEHVSIDVCFENPASFEPAVRPTSIFRNIRHGRLARDGAHLSLSRAHRGPDRQEDLRRRRARVLQRPGYRHD